MNNHKYILEPYKGMKTRYHCPYCQDKKKSFTRYIDTETGEYLHSTVGKCERINNCGVHYTPKQYFIDNDIKFESTDHLPQRQPPQPQPVKPISYIEPELFKASLKRYDQNPVISYLNRLFGPKITTGLIEKYFIGTSKHWKGSTIFWQIDLFGKIRTGKVMLFNPITGKRVKEPFNHITWVHTLLKQKDFNSSQCFFGLHLIKDKSKTIAIVEAERTAIVASVYLPQYIWLAVGNLSNLSLKLCSPLAGRTIILFPDIKGYEAWNEKAKAINSICTVSVSDLLEKEVSNDQERKDGLDIEDYLTRYDWKQFIQPEPTKEIKHQTQQSTQQDRLEKMINKNPALGILIDKLGLTHEPNPTEINIWSNDIQSTVNAIKATIKPQTQYTTDDINKLIPSIHTAETIHYNQIIERLINDLVIEVNPFYKDTYYKHGSTPF